MPPHPMMQRILQWIQLWGLPTCIHWSQAPEVGISDYQPISRSRGTRGACHCDCLLYHPQCTFEPLRVTPILVPLGACGELAICFNIQPPSTHLCRDSSLDTGSSCGDWAPCLFLNLRRCFCCPSVALDPVLESGLCLRRLS